MIDKLKSLTVQQKQLLGGVIAVLLVAAAAIVFVVTRDDDGGGSNSLGDNVAFKVGDQEVTISQLNERNQLLQSLYPDLKPPGDDKALDSYNRSSAKSMALSIVLERAADKMKIEIPDAAIDKLIKDYVASLGGENAYLDKLTEAGASKDSVRKEARRKLEVVALQEAILEDVEVADDELKAGFEEFKAKLGDPARREVSNVVVTTRAQADQVRNRLQQGESIATIAKQVSLDEATRASGGRLGAVAKAEFEAPVGEAVFKTPVGGIYGPVQGEFGWNVGVVTKIIPPREATLKQDGDRLRAVLYLKEATDVLSAWLEEQLRAADVVYAKKYQPEDPYDVNTFSTPEDVQPEPEEGLE